MTEDVVVYVDGNPVRNFRLGDNYLDLVMKRIHGNWHLCTTSGEGLDYPVMYHWHRDEGFISGCFRGSKTCMQCGDDWPEDIEGVVNLYLKGRKWKDSILPLKP